LFSSFYGAKKYGHQDACRQTMVRVLDGVMSKEPTAIAKEILAYFVQNPQAVDSLEGVACWRLQEERIRRQIKDANAALEWLVEKGYLQKISSPFAKPVYRLNEANRSAVEWFLAGSVGAEPEGHKPR
jgi:hypothetical protein